MSVTHVDVRRGAYHDSVTLLQVSRTVAEVDGVEAAQVAMATELNVEVLGTMGFEVPAGTTTNDRLVAGVGLAEGRGGGAGRGDARAPGRTPRARRERRVDGREGCREVRAVVEAERRSRASG